MTQVGKESGGKDAEDPSMEDILASIRRILNDDEPAADASHEVQAAHDPGSVDHAAPPHDDVFVLDQSMLVEAPPPAPPIAVPRAVIASPATPAIAATMTAPQTPSAAAAIPEPHSQEPHPQDSHPQEPHFQQAPLASMTSTPTTSPPSDAAEALMAPSTAAAASASMGALVRVIGQQQTPVYRGGPTLEDMVRDELRPMVKSWLDEHLAPMVERMVRAEIARVTEGK